jgi:hypothetical protein
MRIAKHLLPLLFVCVCLTVNANAVCPNGPQAVCVTSVTISPATISGDDTTLANALVTVHVYGDAHFVSLAISELNFGSTRTICTGGGLNGGGCNYGVMGPGM